MRITLGALLVIGLCARAGAEECAKPNVLIVFDRSGSMWENEVGGRTLWDVAVDATSDLVTRFDDEVRFGMGLFPGGDPEDRCVTGTHEIDVGDMRAGEIIDLLEDTDRREGTPIAASIQAIAAAESALSDPTRPQYVLLVTDGKENCDGDPADIVGDLRARTPEVKTFVVGFGGDVDEDELDALAVAGGTARMGTPRYYQADDAAALEAAFAEIGTLVSGGDPEFPGCDPGVATDASEVPWPDSGSPPDGGDVGGGGAGGAGGGEEGESVSACGCDAGGRTRAAGWLALLALFAVRRRR